MGTSGTLAGLQAVRFGAALAVLIFHVFAYGRFLKVIPDDRYMFTFLGEGVPVFFVLSGFLMSKLADEMSVGRFIAHRLLRIYPPYWAATALALLASLAAFGHASGYNPLALSLIPLGPTYRFMLLPDWTLVYEVYFYAFTALLCILPSWQLRRALVVAWVFIILWFSGEPRGQFGFPTFSEMPVSPLTLYLLAGMIARWCFTLAQQRRYLACSACAGFLLPAFWQFPVAIAAIALILLASTRQVGAIVERIPLLMRGGDASFGIYLLHLPVLYIFFSTSGMKGDAALVTGFVLSVAIGSLFGLIEHLVYERTRRRIDRLFVRRVETSPAFVT